MSHTISDAPNENDIIRLLSDPSNYDHPVDQIDIVQTHASYVALVGDYVYKIKKPVNFGFLDFSTLEKRHHYCSEEVRLNSRICPEIYLNILPIVAIGDELRFSNLFEDDGPPPVEYAIKMIRLDKNHFLLDLLENNHAREDDIDRIANKLYHFYKSIPEDQEIAQFGKVDHIKVNTDENFDQLEPYLKSTITEEQLNGIRYYTDNYFALHKDLFERRVQEGHIKDCHGDLHLEHIHISEDSICIYDCIEFNERFRYIDVANDIAFLSMDLDFRGYGRLARYFRSRIVDLMDDPDIHYLMDFYKCYRAVVRGKVNSFTTENSRISLDEVKQHANTAQKYFQLALNYAVTGSNPIIIGMTGMVGSGKSALSKRLQYNLGWDRYLSDEIRKEIAGLPFYYRGSEEERSELYSSSMTARTYDQLFERADDSLSAGKSVILDATFRKEEYRIRLKEMAASHNARFVIIETTASDTVLQERLKRRDTNTDEVSDARLEDFEFLKSGYQSPIGFNEYELIQVNTEGDHTESTTQALKRLIDLHLKS